jgi:hypothetical protein
MSRHPEGPQALTPAERQRRRRDRLREGPSETDFMRALAVLHRRVTLLQQTVHQAQTLADGPAADLEMILSGTE